VGDLTTPFSGSLDGDGFSVTDLTIIAPTTEYVGLLGLTTGHVHDLQLVDPTVEGKNHVGSFAGYALGNLNNIGVRGATVEGENVVGSVAGVFESGQAQNMFSRECSITGEGYVGGLFGFAQFAAISAGEVTECIVNGGYTVGGIIGYGIENAFSRMLSDADASGTYLVGGIVGRNSSSMTEVVSFGEISCTNCLAGDTVGGIVGWLESGFISGFYDVAKSPEDFSPNRGTPKTLSELQNSATYGWDFQSIWTMLADGLPHLRSMPIFSDPVVDEEESELVCVTGVALGDAGDADPKTFTFDPAGTPTELVDSNGNTIGSDAVSLNAAYTAGALHVYRDGAPIVPAAPQIVTDVAATSLAVANAMSAGPGSLQAIAQQFTNNTNGVFHSLTFQAGKSVAAVGGTLTVKIYDDATGTPTDETLLAQATVDANTLSIFSPTVSFTVSFPTPPTLVSGQKYAIVIEGTQVTGGVVVFPLHTTPVYAGGIAKIRAGATTWQNAPTNLDFGFETQIRLPGLEIVPPGQGTAGERVIVDPLTGAVTVDLATIGTVTGDYCYIEEFHSSAPDCHEGVLPGNAGDANSDTFTFDRDGDAIVMVDETNTPIPFTVSGLQAAYDAGAFTFYSNGTPIVPGPGPLVTDVSIMSPARQEVFHIANMVGYRQNAAQTFTSTVDGTLELLKVRARKASTSIAGTFTVRLRVGTPQGTYPLGGALLGQVSFPASSLPINDTTFLNVTFASPPTLTRNTKYILELDATQVTGSVVTLPTHSTPAYTGGVFFYPNEFSLQEMPQWDFGIETTIQRPDVAFVLAGEGTPGGRIIVNPELGTFTLDTAFSTPLTVDYCEQRIVNPDVTCYEESSAGNAGDANPTTFRFDDGNQSVALVRASGAPIENTVESLEAAYAEGDLRVAINGNDALSGGDEVIDVNNFLPVANGNVTYCGMASFLLGDPLSGFMDAYAQSFVAGQTGAFSSVSLHMLRQVGTTTQGTIDVELREFDDSTGTYDAGTLLATTTFDVSDVPFSDFVTDVDQKFTVVFEELATVTAGERYVLVLRSAQSGWGGDAPYVLTMCNYSALAGEDAYVYSPQFGQWYPFLWLSGMEEDLQFETYIQSGPSLSLPGQGTAGNRIEIDPSNGTLIVDTGVSGTVTVDYCVGDDAGGGGGGARVSGTAYLADGVTPLGIGTTVALSINGGPAVATTLTGANGTFSFDDQSLVTGDLLTLFLQGAPSRALTVHRASGTTVSGVKLRASALRLENLRERTSEVFDTAFLVGGVSTVDVSSLVTVTAEQLLLAPGTILDIPSSTIIELDRDIEVGGMELAGVFAKGPHIVEINGDYSQTAGQFVYEQTVAPEIHLGDTCAPQTQTCGDGTTVGRNGDYGCVFDLCAETIGVLFNGDVTLSGGIFDPEHGTVAFNDDFVGVFRLSGGTFEAPPVLHVRSDWVQTAGVFHHNNGTVIFDGTSHSIDVPSTETFYNVTLRKNNGSSLNVTTGDTVIAQGTLVLGDGDLGIGTIQALGPVTHESGFDGGTGLLSLEGPTVRAVTLADGGSLPRMALRSSAVTLKSPVTSGATAFLEGNVSLEAGKIRVEGGNLQFHQQGSLSMYGGTFEQVSGTTIIGGTLLMFGGTTSVTGGTLQLEGSNTLNGGSIVINGGALVVQNFVNFDGATLSVDGGSTVTFNSQFRLFSNTITLDDATIVANSGFEIVNGILTATPGVGVLDLNGPVAIHAGIVRLPEETRIAGDVTLAQGASFNTQNGLIIADGLARLWTLPVGVRFHDFTVNKQSNFALAFSPTGRIVTIDGILALESGLANSGVFEAHGDVTVAGSTFLGGNAALHFVGTEDQLFTVNDNPAAFTADIRLAKSAGVVTLGAPLTLATASRDLTVTDGSVLDLGGFDLLATGQGADILINNGGILQLHGTEELTPPTLAAGSTVRYALPTGSTTVQDLPYHHLTFSGATTAQFTLPATLDVNGNLTVSEGILTGTDGELHLLGDWIVEEGGTFQPGTSSVILEGPTHRIEGSTTYHHLSMETSEPGVLLLEAGETQTVAGTLTLSGDTDDEACTFLALRSTTEGSRWMIDVQGTAVLSTLDVQDGESLGENPLACTTECVDRGNTENWTFEASFCQLSLLDCGNGFVEQGEICDDDNRTAGDGCSPLCAPETGFECIGSPSVCAEVCGDNVKVGDETCDDGNSADDDGCSKSCGIETGFTCSGTPSLCVGICGDGLVRGVEVCDDDNTDAADGCSATCTVEPGFTCSGNPSVCIEVCGDGVRTVNEACDDGNILDGDGCSVTCTVGGGFSCTGSPSICRGICGDGLLLGDESCDDGNAIASDGCSATCETELGFECTGVPSACVAICGDGRKTGAEACDDGNLQIGDGCTATCTVETGFLCSGNPSICGALCGDGRRLGAEQCDDHNAFSGDGCSSLCRIEDGYTCENTEPSICRSLCPAGDTSCVTTLLCGNGTREGVEQCDDGNDDNTDGCLNHCVNAWCGDGFLRVATEQCDPPNTTLSTSALGDERRCDRSCRIVKVETNTSTNVKPTKPNTIPTVREPVVTLPKPPAITPLAPVCGNGKIEGEETCDHGRENGVGICSALCQLLRCGDGITTARLGEQCDDSNTINTDGCSNECQLRTTTSTPDGPRLITLPDPGCGNGILEQDEQCDDGNKNNDDGCNAICAIERPAAPEEPERQDGCGNAVLEPGEQCDDGNTRASDGCNASCQIEGLPEDEPEPVCGDGRTDSGEQCDDGNRRAGDGCSAECSREVEVAAAGVCGDGKLDKEEQCDEGGLNSDTRPGSCRTDCTMPRCGDGVRETSEQCDDGDRVAGDGCNAVCALEMVATPAVCGDGFRAPAEQCEDGNLTNGDGCNRFCLTEIHPDEFPADAIRITVLSPTKIRIEFRVPVNREVMLDVLRYLIRGSPQIPVVSITQIDSRTVEIILAEPLESDHLYTVTVDAETELGASFTNIAQFSYNERTLAQVANQHPSAPTGVLVPTEPVPTTPVVTGTLPVATIPVAAYVPTPVITPSGTTVGETGPAAISFLAMGAAAGLAWVKRRRKSK
jgi:cysteine-rich repeat protein